MGEKENEKENILANITTAKCFIPKAWTNQCFSLSQDEAEEVNSFVTANIVQ